MSSSSDLLVLLLMLFISLVAPHSALNVSSSSAFRDPEAVVEDVHR